MEKADKLKSSFTGDPSFFAFDGEEDEQNPVDEVILHYCQVLFISTADMDHWISHDKVVCCFVYFGYVYPR